MKNKSAVVVISLGVVFIIIGFIRSAGIEVSGSVVTLISIIAALISFSDLLVIAKHKKYANRVLLIALILFGTIIIIAVFRWNLDFLFTQSIGDGSTIIGLGLVILLYGLKENYNKDLVEEKQLNHGKNEEEQLNNDQVVVELKYGVTKNEYEEMMKINHIIVNLKKIDKQTSQLNTVHDGWAILFDHLYSHWDRRKGPFYDGKNRELFHLFLNRLDEVTEIIANIADPNPSITTFYVSMWDKTTEVSVQQRINNWNTPSTNTIEIEINETLELWNDLKKLIIDRYEKEHSEQKN
ncbi:APC family permease [Cytobacillus sp. IB215665]|uniref:APC family permease n=1 Tax=Cytobacillus sp. IB215665 TaxID=3097357 RepID=UPI002A103843|nr:APC family permease [Cytobacillus sp. IB215665]MDX8367141.1 APC family permease [Cytobacillus sp. IB215665]